MPSCFGGSLTAATTAHFRASRVGRHGLSRCCSTAALLVASLSTAEALDFQAPGLDPQLLRVTVFAEGLNYPVGMTPLDDGSLLVATTNATSYFAGGTGSLVRLFDADGDGVAEQRQTLVNNVPGGKLTALDRAGDLVAVTGQGSGVPISFYRLGATPADPLTFAGKLDLNYPSGGWLHPHSSLLLRQVGAAGNQYELYFQLGSDTNFAETTRTVNLTGSLGISARLAGDALHRVELTDGPGGLVATNVRQIATGLRNPTGLTFHPLTGDLLIGDNGIDGVVDANEPTSADELNVLPLVDLGQTIVDFGFPGGYEEYRTGETIGGGVTPLVAFQPLPMPDGAEAEGVNEIAFSPALFPAPLAGGVFAGFHGRFNLGGLANEENPLVYVDLDAGQYAHVVTVDEPNVGHLDGLRSTPRTLYVSDISPNGGFSSNNANRGRIYAITSLIEPGDYDRNGVTDGSDLLHWQRAQGTELAAWFGADGDGDGQVADADRAIWEEGFGNRVGASAAPLPEPASAWGALIGLALLGRRRPVKGDKL